MTASPPIRVLLVDDHTMVRRGLTTFLKVYDDLQLVGEAATGVAAIQLCGRLLPDVVLMDLVMPGMDGVEATRVIRRKFPTVQVIALTSFNEEGLVQSVLRAGAISYLLKDVSGQRIGPGHSRRPHRPFDTLSGGHANINPHHHSGAGAGPQSDQARADCTRPDGYRFEQHGNRDGVGRQPLDNQVPRQPYPGQV